MKLLLQDAVAVATGICSIQNCRLSAEATLILARNLNKLKAAVPDADVQKARILEEEGNPPETDPRYKQVVEKFNSFMKETSIEVDLTPLRFESLAIGVGDNKNHISPMLIAQLAPMLDSSAS